MLDHNVRLANHMNFDQYHQWHYQGFTGFPHYHNTNIDKVCKFLDTWPFQTFKEYEEQNKAYDINYAHGLELDDMFGDPNGIDRNGMDDIEYRFVLKCHRLAVTCNGTLPELINFVATALDCSPQDVTLGMARHFVNGKLTGEPDAILVKDINIANVPNDQLVPLLSKELQVAVAADKSVDQVDFYTITPNSIYIAPAVSIHATLILPLSDKIKDDITTDISENIGITARFHARLTLNRID